MATNKVDISQTSMTADELAGHLEGLMKRVKNGSWGKQHFHAIDEGRDPFAPAKSPDVSVNDQVERWRAHYKGLYKMNPDFSNLYIPERTAQQGVEFKRLIIVPKGLSHYKCVEIARTIHEVSLYEEDLDGLITDNERTSRERSYGVWIRDRQEADAELNGMSPNMLVENKISGVTLLERLVAGTGYLFEKMCHMDRSSVTLCIGSRCSGDGVPHVGVPLIRREVCVRRCPLSDSHSIIRAREVVS
jgi:hypothetical protein